MLTNQNIFNISAVKAAGAKVYSADSKNGRFDYPVFDAETIEEISPETLIVLINRRLRDDYRNKANRPASIGQISAEMAAIANDDSLTAEEKARRMAARFNVQM